MSTTYTMRIDEGQKTLISEYAAAQASGVITWATIASCASCTMASSSSLR